MKRTQPPVLHRIRCFCTRVNRVIQGSRVLWRNEEWDYENLLHLMEWKLGRMESVIRNGNALYAEKEANRIRICKNLLNRLRKDEYYTERCELLINEWWESREEIELEDGTIYMKFKEDPKAEKRRHAERARIDKIREHEWDMLFRIMKTHMRKWWD